MVATNYPPFLAQKNLKPFITKDLTLATTPVNFRIDTGPSAHGYSAELLPQVCEVYLKARDADVFLPSQTHIAEQADLLMRGFAHVGIIALIDEATGYQEVRDKQDLHSILDRYLSPRCAAYAKTFPDEFYKEIFRLKGWEWQGMQVNRPQVVGHYTNDIVYSRLAPGLLTQLELFNPKLGDGERGHKHYQHLTENVGYPGLIKHLSGAIAIMNTVTHHNPNRAWSECMRRIQRWRSKGQYNLRLGVTR